MSTRRSRRAEAMLVAAGGSLDAANKEEAAPKDQQATLDKMIPSIGGGSKRAGKGSTGAAVTDDGSKDAGSKGPAEEQPAAVLPLMLPSELVLLQTMFEAMLSGRALLKRRSEKVTVQSLTPIVENSTGRSFKIQHVQQIKALYPGAFDWEYVRAPSQQDPNKLEYQLLLNFDRPAPASSGLNPTASVTSQQQPQQSAAAPEGSGLPPRAPGSSAGRLNEAAERAAFRERVHAWFKEQQATVAAAANAPGDAVPQAQAQPACPPIPCAPLPARENCVVLGVSPRCAGRAGSSPMSSLNLGGAGAGGGLRRAASGQAPSLGGPRGVAASPGGSAVSMQGASMGPGGGGGLLSRQGSILDSLQQRMAGRHESLQSPIPKGGAGTPTSRQQLKRKASDMDGSVGSKGVPGAGAAAAAGPGSAAGAGAAGVDGGRGAPRRRLRLGPVFEAEAEGKSTPVGKTQPSPAEGAAQQEQAGAQQQMPGLSPFAAPAAQQAPVPPASQPGTPSHSQSTQAGGAQHQQPGSGGLMSRQASGAGGPSQPSSGSKARNPLLARFFSNDSLQAFERNTVAAGSSGARQAAAEQRHALGLLPEMLDLVRAVFGTKGPVAKPRDEVRDAMVGKSSLSTGLSAVEASTALDLLAQHAPEAVCIEKQGGMQVVRVRHDVDIVAVRKRLRALGSAPPSRAASGDVAMTDA